MRLAKSVPWSLLVNRFTGLNIEEVNTDICEPLDIPLPSTPDKKALPRRLKWEKRLPKQLSANTLNAYGTFIILPIEISTTDTSEVHSIKMLLDSGATGSFIDKDFVHTKDISTQSISYPIPVYVRATRVELREIPQLIIIYEIWLQPTSRRFLRELDEAPGGNNLHYIL